MHTTLPSVSTVPASSEFRIALDDGRLVDPAPEKFSSLEQAVGAFMQGEFTGLREVGEGPAYIITEHFTDEFGISVWVRDYTVNGDLLREAGEL